MSCGRAFDTRVNTGNGRSVAPVEGFNYDYGRGDGPFTGVRRGAYANVVSQQTNWLNAPPSGPILGVQAGGVPVAEGYRYTGDGFIPSQQSDYATLGRVGVEGTMPSVWSQSIIGWPALPSYPQLVVSTPAGNIPNPRLADPGVREPFRQGSREGPSSRESYGERKRVWNGSHLPLNVIDGSLYSSSSGSWAQQGRYQLS